MQTRLESLLEAVVGVAIGMLSSIALSAVLFPLLGHKISFGDNMIITCAFTVMSLVRTYYVRRWFNRVRLRDKIHRFAQRFE